MGKTSPSLKTATKKKIGAKPTHDSSSVLVLVERLSELLIAFRKREGLDQKQMAELMDIGQSRYNEIEKLRNLNPDFGVSLAFLLKFSELEKTNLSTIAEAIQTKQADAPTKRDQIDESLLNAFSGVKLEHRNQLSLAKSAPHESEAIQDRIKWLTDLGLDLFSVSTQEQLEFEMRVHQQLLKAKSKSRLTQDERRQRLTLIMRELIEIS